MGLLRGVARTAVVAGTATAVSNRVSRRQAGRWAAQEEQQVQQQAPPQQYAAPPQQQYAPPPPDAPDPDADLARLQQLGELRASGVLTEQEFQTQKSRILGL
ncbi:SHOCT domain-containing protein [Terrabacter sp. Ter38]|uniref:SHOCT domain-containing protein n=1 Tax=Terrabacter sp. Ter38 TaxID=2926030 RepID=UPI002118F3F6|nr:SHOCT domain-containing protein [Terrabacter sp. Ter38]